MENNKSANEVTMGCSFAVFEDRVLSLLQRWRTFNPDLQFDTQTLDSIKIEGFLREICDEITKSAIEAGKKRIETGGIHFSMGDKLKSAIHCPPCDAEAPTREVKFARVRPFLPPKPYSLVHDMASGNELLDAYETYVNDSGRCVPTFRTRLLLWDSEDFDADDYEGLVGLARQIRDFAEDKPNVLVHTNRIDWTDKSGYKVIGLMRPDNEVFNDLYPDYDCTFRLYKDEDKMYAMVSSHDIPCGARWDIIPMLDVEKTMDELVEKIGDGSKSNATKQSFISDIEAIFGLDISRWNKLGSTPTSCYLSHRCSNVLEISDVFTIYLDDRDNIVEKVEYDEDNLLQCYIKSIIS